MTLPLRESKGCLLLSVHAQPGASRDEIAGLHGGRLKVRVSAPPEGGRANRAVIAACAEALGVPVHSLSLVSGATSRRKEVAVEGLDLEEARGRLRAVIA